MSEQQSTNSPSPPGQRRRATMILVFAAIGVLGVAAIGFVWVKLFGSVYGEEFSPDLFQRRRFAYQQIPLLGIQVSPVIREDTTGALERDLIRQNLINLAGKSKPRWDLVSDNVHAADSPDCDAKILCAYLEGFRGTAGEFWQQWTSDHPEQAKLFWPAVAEVARAELYVLVPKLFDAAQAAATADELKTALRATLTENYSRIAANRQAQGNHERAVELFTKALAHNPADVEALRGRAESLTALGKQEKAAADLAQAKKLSGKRL